MDDLSKIIKNLSDKSPLFGKGRRKKAVEKLSKIGTKEIVLHLVSALSDSDSNIKRHAFSALCHLSNPSAIDSLCLLYLKDRDKKVWEIIISKGFRPSSNRERILFFIKTGQISKCIPPSEEDIPILIEMLDDSEIKKEASRILSSINDNILKEKIFDDLFLNTNPPLFSFLINTGWAPQDEGKRLIFYLLLEKEEDALFIEKRKNGSFIAGYKLLGLKGKNTLISLLLKKPGLSSFLFELILFENNLEIMKVVFKTIIENNIRSALFFFLKRKEEDFIINIMNSIEISNEHFLEIGLQKGGLVLCMVSNCLKKRGWKTDESLLLEFMEYVREIEDEILKVNIEALGGNKRKGAASILSMIKDERAIESIISLLKDENFKTRRLASNCLISISGNKVLSLLTEALKEENWALRVIAAESLGRMGQKAIVEFLIKALSQEEWGVQEEACISLAKLHSPSSQEAFIKALRYNNIKIRKIATASLGKIGTDIAIKPLIKALDDRDEVVRLQASYSIANIGKRYAFRFLIEGKSLHAKEGIVRALGKQKNERFIDILLHSLNDSDFKIRREVIKSLGMIGKSEVIPSLIKMFQDEKLEVKREAALALCKLGEEKGFGIVVEGIKSKNWRVQMKMAYIISNYIVENRERALKMLAELVKDQNPQIRACAIIALGMMKDEKSVPTLLMAWTQEREIGIRKRIITSIINIGSEKGQRAFILGLQDKDDEIRAISAKGFGKLRIKDGFTPLLEKIDNFGAKGRKAIFLSLRQIIDEFGMEIPEKNLVALDKKIKELGDVKREANEITEILLLRLSLGVLKYKKKSQESRVWSLESEVWSLQSTDHKPQNSPQSIAHSPQTTEDRGQKRELRTQNPEFQNQNPEPRIPNSEPRSGVWSQELGVSSRTPNFL